MIYSKRRKNLKNNGKMIFLAAGTALFLRAFSYAAADSVSIKSSVDKPRITIGDKITYSLSVIHDAKLNVKLPDIASSLASFEIKDYETDKPKRKGGKLIRSYSYVITTFTTGEYRIEPSTVTFTNEKGEEKEIASSPITIFVESVKPSESDRDDIRDIKEPLSIARSPLFYLLGFGLPLLVAAGGAAYYFTRRKGEGGFFAEKEKSKLPDELAYERLMRLKEMNLCEKGEIKQHYIILAEIIRKYMEAIYDIPVLDRTTCELCQELNRINADRRHVRVIKDFLDECDMVKFAKYRPAKDTVETDLEAGKKIVDITRPLPEPEVGKANDK